MNQNQMNIGTTDYSTPTQKQGFQLEISKGNRNFYLGFLARVILVIIGCFLPLYTFYCGTPRNNSSAFCGNCGVMIKKKSFLRKILLIPVVFLLCMLVATAVELVTSYLCEMVMGSWPWQTYAVYKYNFQARIALSPSIRFGIGGVLFLYLLQPIFEWTVKKTGS